MWRLSEWPSRVVACGFCSPLHVRLSELKFATASAAWEIPMTVVAIMENCRTASAAAFRPLKQHHNGRVLPKTKNAPRRSRGALPRARHN